MKIKSTTIACVLAFHLTINAQNGSTLELKKGMKIKTEIISYTTPLGTDAAKWIKMKPAKKAEAVIAHNASIASEKLKHSTSSIYLTSIDSVNSGIETQIFSGTTQLGNATYKLDIECRKDSVFYKINGATPFFIVDKKNDTLGINCYGVKKYYNKASIGSAMPGSVNEMNLFPYDLKISKRRYVMFNGNDGYNYSGFVNVRKTLKMQVSTINLTTNAVVDTIREIEISGKKYSAYVLIGEYWSKFTGNSIVTDEPLNYTDDPYVNKLVKDHLASSKNPKKESEILQKMQSKTGFYTNEQGYTVNIVENWYVPELGLIAFSKFYDATGALQMVSQIKSIVVE